MALRTVRSFLHNETSFPLTLTQAIVDEGAWGDDGRQRPPPTIVAGGTAMIRSESSGFPPAGTEAHVIYRIGSDSTGNVALHWDNPLVGHNSYNQATDADHFVFRVGGPGDDAVVHFFLRPAGARSTGFVPDRDGFQFGNYWPDTPYSLPPLRGSVLDFKYGNAANGLCGGMVFAARDYFEAGRSIPATRTAPFGERDPLFLYLVDRQFATFSVDSVALMLKLMNPAYPDEDENVLAALGLASGRASVMANEEWPLIRADIEAGRPSPMVLITVKSALPWDLGKCHQVLAYAYDVHGDEILLRVYDPNQPRINGVYLRFNIRTVAERIVVEHNVAVQEEDGHILRPIYCFAHMNYTVKAPTVATPPRPSAPPVDVPRQVSLEVVGSEILNSWEVERGRKKYEVFDCGEHEFDFTRVAEQYRRTIEAHAVSYADPQVTWWLNDAPVPAGTDQTCRPHPSELGDAYLYDPDYHLSGEPVTVRTTTDGLLLYVGNAAREGGYGLTARAEITERDGSEARQSSIGIGFPIREIVPGLNEAFDSCVSSWLRELRMGTPTDEAIAAAALAELNRPVPLPLWDPDPLADDMGWQAGIVDPDRAELLDPAQQVDPDTVVPVTTGDRGRVVVTTPRTEVVTIETGVDETVEIVSSGGDVTVTNTTSRDLVVVDPRTHRAVGVIPADREVSLRVVKTNG
jgi:hypothetical protein